MAKSYVFRLDDISWDMNYENFCRIRNLFFMYGIQPLIGVIPKNEDPKLKSQVGIRRISEQEFWDEMYELQSSHGWSVALHGYEHVYVTANGGMFNINPWSEFAGLSYKQQEEKIRRGKAILEEHGLTIDAFMAPGHSLDWNTVEALKENGIFTVTDGIAVYPYWKYGMLFIPQVWSWPKDGIWGIETVCLHINSWNENLFEHLEHFLQNNQKHCISFSDAIRAGKKNDNFRKKFLNGLICPILLIEKKARKIVSHLKNDYKK